MKKAELIDALASQAEISKAQATETLTAVLDAITKELSGGGTVTLTGFGTFSVANRKARVGVNPRTGEKIQIAATKTPKFKAGKGLKDAVR